MRQAKGRSKSQTERGRKNSNETRNKLTRKNIRHEAIFFIVFFNMLCLNFV